MVVDIEDQIEHILQLDILAILIMRCATQIVECLVRGAEDYHGHGIALSPASVLECDRDCNLTPDAARAVFACSCLTEAYQWRKW